MKHNPRANLDENSYCMLQKKLPDKISCEICEKSFDNRYKSIIHNAYHIIIPLIKQEYHQCHKCLFYFETIDALVTHLVKKHNEVITKLDTSNDEENLEDVIVIDDDDDDDEDKIVNNTWNLAIDKRVSSFEIGHAMLDVEEKPKEEFILPDVYYDVKISPNCANIETIKKILPQPLQNFAGDVEKNKEKCNKEKNLRIQHFSVINETICKKDFEVDDGIILDNDFNNEVDENTCTFKKPFLEKEVKVEPKTHIIESEEYLKSIHYDKLIAPRNVICEICKEQFPNKFQMIEHRGGHIRIIQSRIAAVVCMECDKYIGVPKQHRKHFKKKHPNCTPKSRTYLKICIICKFKYFNYKKHVDNYHPELFKVCQGSDLGENSGVSKYGNITFECLNKPSGLPYTNILEVCDICLEFIRSKKRRCTMLGVVRQIGVRFKCCKCLKQCFEINLVEKYTTTKEVGFVSKIKYEEESKKRKSLSNEDRLKNIQMRMKMINKLSRFYTVFYL